MLCAMKVGVEQGINLGDGLQVDGPKTVTRGRDWRGTDAVTAGQAEATPVAQSHDDG